MYRAGSMCSVLHIFGSNLSRAQTPHEGDHSSLIKELVKHKAFFTENEFWALPYDHGSPLPLRMDSKVILYRGNGPVGYSLYDTYAVMGGAPITNRPAEQKIILISESDCTQED